MRSNFNLLRYLMKYKNEEAVELRYLEVVIAEIFLLKSQL